MYLKDLAKIIYTPDTLSEDRKITVIQHNNRQILWTGKAKYLKEFANKGWIKGWIVVEILVDIIVGEEDLPDINKSKIITVE